MSYMYQSLMNKNLQDLNPVLAGRSACPPGCHTIPDARHSTLIHYVAKGKGTLHLGQKNYPVREQQAFIILPGQAASYTADLDDPWEVCWVGFTGQLSEAFGRLSPVFDVPEEMFINLKTADLEAEGAAYHLAADLFYIYGTYLHVNAKRLDYIRAALEYIQANYAEALTVQQIADHVGLNRYYLSRLFKKKTSRSVQEQILDVRLSEARRYLILGYSVKETAMLCGYSAPSIFSKLFKKEYGMSPSAWKSYKTAELAASKK